LEDDYGFFLSKKWPWRKRGTIFWVLSKTAAVIFVRPYADQINEYIAGGLRIPALKKSRVTGGGVRGSIIVRRETARWRNVFLPWETVGRLLQKLRKTENERRVVFFSEFLKVQFGEEGI